MSLPYGRTVRTGIALRSARRIALRYATLMAVYKGIISDIDGTIAPVMPHSRVSRKVRDAIRDLVARSVPFVLATGKPYRLIEHLIRDLGITSPVITDNGAAIYNPRTREPLWISYLPDSDSQRILELSRPFGKTVRVSDGMSSMVADPEIPTGMNVTKFVITDMTPAEADGFIRNAETVLKDVAVVRTSSYRGDGYYDIYVTHAGATKQQAILTVAKLLGLGTQELVGIGDQYNDFPLLVSCGWKVAMGNAVSDLKAIADYIAPSVDEDGVADVIGRYFPR